MWSQISICGHKLALHEHFVCLNLDFVGINEHFVAKICIIFAFSEQNLEFHDRKLAFY